MVFSVALRMPSSLPRASAAATVGSSRVDTDPVIAEGKKDKGHCHAGKDSEQCQRVIGSHAGKHQVAGNQDGFPALQKRQQYPVGGKRQGQNRQFPLTAPKRA